MKTDPDSRATSTRAEPSRRLVRATVLEHLRRCKQARGGGFRVSRLGVFGSVARDEAGGGSDVDIVFETDAPKQIDRKTAGQLLPRYPEVDWVGVKGVRDVVAHGYFDVDAEQVFAICQQDVPVPLKTVRRVIDDLAGWGPDGWPPSG